MKTELGTVTHRYWFDDKYGYSRQLLAGGPVEVWNGGAWACVELSRKAG